VSAANGTEHVFEVRGLHASAGGREVLHGIDLTLRSGEVHVIMGPNGSGKSTLAHALMGRPGTEVTAGSIRMDGRDLATLPAWERARAGMFLALQHPVEVPGVRLHDLLDAAMSGSGGASMTDAATVSATSLDDRMVDEAKADEVDSGLDVDALGEVARRLQLATTEWGVGILAITHFSRFLVQLEADLVHVMVDGRIVATGDAALALQLEQTGYAGYHDEGSLRTTEP